MRKRCIIGFLGTIPLLAAALSCVGPAPAAGQGAVRPGREVSPLTDGQRAEQLSALIVALRPLHREISPPGPMDWLAQHPEPGQTFRDYLACDPVRPVGSRNTLYLQPIGDFDKPRWRLLTRTAEFLHRFYGCPVNLRPTLPLSVIPASARRHHPDWGMEQLRTGYILHQILKPSLPPDAAAVLALTPSDLWPGAGWNFVFGQASLRERVGVWSLFRFGDPSTGDEAFRRCLLRTLKTASHETGHMFSLLHCTAWECGMCGSNHQEESDRRPLWFCPECEAKVCWAARLDPVARFRSLAAFCEGEGLKPEAGFYRRSADHLAPPR